MLQRMDIVYLGVMIAMATLILFMMIKHVDVTLVIMECMKEPILMQTAERVRGPQLTRLRIMLRNMGRPQEEEKQMPRLLSVTVALTENTATITTLQVALIVDQENIIRGLHVLSTRIRDVHRETEGACLVLIVLPI